MPICWINLAVSGDCLSTLTAKNFIMLVLLRLRWLHQHI